ncbi:hypothetical protein [Haloarcula halophila]
MNPSVDEVHGSLPKSFEQRQPMCVDQTNEILRGRRGTSCSS